MKADRWSCGRVLLHHMMVGKGDKRLSKFAEQLMANDPQQRPSLVEWDKWFAPSPKDLKTGEKETRPREDVIEADGEGTKPPDAKKPRVAVTGAPGRVSSMSFLTVGEEEEKVARE